VRLGLLLGIGEVGEMGRHRGVIDWVSPVVVMSLRVVGVSIVRGMVAVMVLLLDL